MEQAAKDAAAAVMDGKMVTGNFTIQAQLPSGKTLTMSGYIYSDATPEGINDQINLFMDAVDYQRTRAEIPELESRYGVKKKMLVDMIDHVEALKKEQDNLKPGKNLVSTKKLDLQNGIANMDKLRKDLEEGLIAINEARAKIGWGPYAA